MSNRLHALGLVLLMLFGLTFAMSATSVVKPQPAQAAGYYGVPCAVAHDGPYMSGPGRMKGTFITDCRKHGHLIDSVTVSLQAYKIVWDRKLNHAVLKSMGRGKTVVENNDVAAVTIDAVCADNAQYTLFFHTQAKPTANAKWRGFKDPAFAGRNVTKPVKLNCDTETDEWWDGKGPDGFRGPWGGPYRGPWKPDNDVKLCSYGPALLPCPPPNIAA